MVGCRVMKTRGGAQVVKLVGCACAGSKRARSWDAAKEEPVDSKGRSKKCKTCARLALLSRIYTLALARAPQGRPPLPLTPHNHFHSQHHHLIPFAICATIIGGSTKNGTHIVTASQLEIVQMLSFYPLRDCPPAHCVKRGYLFFGIDVRANCSVKGSRRRWNTQPRRRDRRC